MTQAASPIQLENFRRPEEALDTIYKLVQCEVECHVLEPLLRQAVREFPVKCRKPPNREVSP